MNSRQAVAVFVLVVIFFPSCQDHGVEGLEGGVGIIVPGRGIEGVVLGDSKLEVEEKLGEPTRKGWTDGLYRSWRNYEYRDGPHAGLSVDFIDNIDNYGPVDLLQVETPYKGKTKEGIGIGSSLNEVRRIYGQPRHILANAGQHWLADFYCFGKSKLEVHYIDSTITGISIGYYVPLTQDTLSSCP